MTVRSWYVPVADMRGVTLDAEPPVRMWKERPKGSSCQSSFSGTVRR
jgi:hypothetical protein